MRGETLRLLCVYNYVEWFVRSLCINVYCQEPRLPREFWESWNASTRQKIAGTKNSCWDCETEVPGDMLLSVESYQVNVIANLPKMQKRVKPGRAVDYGHNAVYGQLCNADIIVQDEAIDKFVLIQKPKLRNQLGKKNHGCIEVIRGGEYVLHSRALCENMELDTSSLLPIRLSKTVLPEGRTVPEKKCYCKEKEETTYELLDGRGTWESSRLDDKVVQDGETKIKTYMEEEVNQEEAKGQKRDIGQQWREAIKSEIESILSKPYVGAR
ncbi:hypothetical protein Tco_1509648 [Tanacetum coccineum]